MNWIPEAASSFAGRVDAVLWFITIISLIFFVLISALLVYFAWKYRRKQEDEETPYITGSVLFEALWTVIPSILLFVIFAYGFVVYRDMRTPPKEASEINVIAKQWIWQFQYTNGKTSVNELFLQQNRPVKLVMKSDDVIHDLFVPAFRAKMDILGNIYTYQWFTPTEVGVYDFYCAEYCGTGHSAMLGKVFVLSPEAYQRWESGDAEKKEAVAGLSPVDQGKQLYAQRGCNACHTVDGGPGIAPTFKGLFGRQEALQSGGEVTADENYIRESILEPQAKIVQGFPPVMPSFKGILNDQEISAVIAYLKTLQ